MNKPYSFKFSLLLAICYVFGTIISLAIVAFSFYNIVNLIDYLNKYHPNILLASILTIVFVVIVGNTAIYIYESSKIYAKEKTPNHSKEPQESPEPPNLP